MTPMLSMVMGLSQSKNPQAFNGISQAMQAGQNPQALVQQIFGNMNTQQREQIIKQAGQMGCPKNILSQIQNIK